MRGQKCYDDEIWLGEARPEGLVVSDDREKLFVLYEGKVEVYLLSMNLVEKI